MTAPMDLSGLQTISLHDRPGKVTVADFAPVYEPGAKLLSLFPTLLAGNSFRKIVEAIFQAKRTGKPVLWGIGGHVIKCGLAPVLIDLMHHGFATSFSMNGSAAIHDYEIALCGSTSEDVESVLPDGRFGSAEETGREMNGALLPGLGLGEAYCASLKRAPFADQSLLAHAGRAGVPITVHVAIGTDTPHTHPTVNPAALGAATHHDFRVFCTLVSQMNEGGVYLNIGSAVIMPEVFLKAISAVRNLGHPLKNFTTANFDFLQHYRPRMNVVDRPHAGSGGKGYSITGHHELMIPLLAMALREAEA
jgi:hypothetical protein